MSGDRLRLREKDAGSSSHGAVTDPDCGIVVNSRDVFLILTEAPLQEEIHIHEYQKSVPIPSGGERIQDYQLEKAFIAVTPGHTSTPADIVKALEGHRSEKVRAYPELLSIKRVVRGSSSKSAFKIFEALPSGTYRTTQKSFGGKEKKQDRTEGGKVEEELSVVGVVQLIKLGEFLSSRYFEQLHSVGAPPGESENLAETTGKLVHFQTLSAFLHGLLMEKQFVATNVAKVGASYCQVAGQLGSICSAAHSALQHLHFFVKEAFRKETVLFKDSKLSGLNVAALLSEGPNDLSAKDAISHVSDRLCAERHHRRVERVRKNPIQVSNADIDLMFNISDSHVAYLSSSEAFQSFARSHSLSLLSFADQWLTCSPRAGSHSGSGGCRDKNDLKTVSIEPLSMLSLLTTLSLPTSQHILPAARLVIEVFNLKSSNNSEEISGSLGYVSEQTQHRKINKSDPAHVRNSFSEVPKMSWNVLNKKVLYLKRKGLFGSCTMGGWSLLKSLCALANLC
ncbi:hypothetical protein EGW08_008420 [Elysia chlorotica]|uniref:Uncharacterized protein n=1 Tax=Elysia chlorotica TaxID=188477 RepID=A0A3S1BLS8_ELYCH|nr:hypothetical protein EGW08_008420 [Elysia chlorotica]